MYVLHRSLRVSSSLVTTFGSSLGTRHPSFDAAVDDAGRRAASWPPSLGSQRGPRRRRWRHDESYGARITTGERPRPRRLGTSSPLRGRAPLFQPPSPPSSFGITTASQRIMETATVRSFPNREMTSPACHCRSQGDGRKTRLRDPYHLARVVRCTTSITAFVFIGRRAPHAPPPRHLRAPPAPFTAPPSPPTVRSPCDCSPPSSTGSVHRARLPSPDPPAAPKSPLLVMRRIPPPARWSARR
mmetsp:Transcript_25930/g.64779  ORF Transcript_25930/g.64779 Transcript_25930/m.64779 type:complete len:243 (+) Transcript_25930:1-729(+)